MSVGGDDKLNVTTLDSWSERFDRENPPFQTLDYSILSIDAAGTAAQVRILFIDWKRRVTDFLNLLKLEERWRVVNIIDFQVGVDLNTRRCQPCPAAGELCV